MTSALRWIRGNGAAEPSPGLGGLNSPELSSLVSIEQALVKLLTMYTSQLWDRFL